MDKYGFKIVAHTHKGLHYFQLVSKWLLIPLAAVVTTIVAATTNTAAATGKLFVS